MASKIELLLFCGYVIIEDPYQYYNVNKTKFFNNLFFCIYYIFFVFPIVRRRQIYYQSLLLSSCTYILLTQLKKYTKNKQIQTIQYYYYSGVHCIVFQCFIVSSLLDFIQCGFKFHYDDIL